MQTAERIKPEEVYRRMQDGNLLLVCAYESDEKFESNALEGAIPMSAFRELVPSLSRDREIVFYCA